MAVKVGNKTYNATVVDGTAVVTLDDLAHGEHEVKVTYSGDGNFTGASTTSKVTAPKAETPISVTVNDINVGDTAKVTVNVPSDASGKVTIEIDGVKYTEEIENGKAVFEIDNLTAGTKTIAVEYAGDGKYAGNHTTDSITVSKCHADINVTIEDVDAGENVTVIVKAPNDATGQILIDIDGVGYYANLTDGVAIAQIPRIPSGNYDVAVTYTGDDKYGPTSDRASFNVTKVESFVVPTAKNIYVGENEVIALSVPVDATGNVTVVIGNKEYNFDLDDGTLSVPDGDEVFYVAIDKGSGTLVISGLPRGEYTVSVKYNGDDKYLPSTNTTVFKVSQSGTDMEVIDLGNRTVVVVLPKDAEGNVTIKVGNETYTGKVVDGKATIDLTNTPHWNTSYYCGILWRWASLTSNSRFYCRYSEV